MASPSSAASAPPLATSERAALCDLFDEVGPSAPTLCEGWDTYRLAAHLRLRVTSPLGLLRTALPPSSGSDLDDLVAGSDFTELVAALRRGPSPLSVFALPQVDRVTSTLEYFVHHEDVRRAEPGWSVRDLPGGSQDEIWSQLRWLARVVMRRSAVGAELVRTDTDDSVRAAKGPDTVVVRGLPGELALFAFGRKDVARVELDGSANAVAVIRGAHLGV